MSKIKDQLNQNIDEAFGALSKRKMKYHTGKNIIERVVVFLPKGETLKNKGVVGMSEIMMHWKFSEVEIDKCKTGIKVIMSI